MDWDVLVSFVSGLDASSALFRSMHPEEAKWLNGSMTAQIMADVFDAVSAFTYIFVKANAKKGHRVKMPKPYPRPGMDKNAGQGKHYGKDPIKAEDFQAWWDSHVGKGKSETTE